MSDYVVVDASVAVKWLVAELNSEEALALVTFWAGTGVTPVAPYLMPAEVANALHKRVVSEELSVATASGLMETLLASGVELRETPILHMRALALASELDQRDAYDSHYLALAEELDCDFWTAVARFYRAAESSVDRIRLLGSVPFDGAHRSPEVGAAVPLSSFGGTVVSSRQPRVPSREEPDAGPYVSQGTLQAPTRGLRHRRPERALRCVHRGRA